MYLCADGVFGAFNEEFNADLCSQYGGTPCEAEVVGVEGCMDTNASIIMQMQQYKVMTNTGIYNVFMHHVTIFQNTDVFMVMALVLLMKNLMLIYVLNMEEHHAKQKLLV